MVHGATIGPEMWQELGYAEGDPFYASTQDCAQAIPPACFVSLPADRHGQDSYQLSWWCLICGRF